MPPLTTSYRSPLFAVTASGGRSRSVAGKLRKIHFSIKLQKIVINQIELQKLQKINMRRKGLNKIFPSIPNLYQKTDTQKKLKKIYVFFSLFFFFFKKTN